MATDHIITYYASLLEIYIEAAALGISVAHITEFYLERWWSGMVEGNSIAVSERSEYSLSC